uniref:Uncharacterized protein n=1 Tax=Mus spicilegus TaxID=10103 RepID=A0A8C6HKZ4_MUSSI
MNFPTPRNPQGLFTPLRSRNGTQSGALSSVCSIGSECRPHAALRGNDETIGSKTILNDPSQRELVGKSHFMEECALGLL